jgi:hypothetical protein
VFANQSGRERKLGPQPVILVFHTSQQEATLTNSETSTDDVRDFLKARIEELSGSKSLEEIARECGLKTARPLEMMLARELKVPINLAPALSRALDVPFIPLWKSLMRHWGSGELADEVCEAIRAEVQSSAAGPAQMKDS